MKEHFNWDERTHNIRGEKYLDSSSCTVMYVAHLKMWLYFQLEYRDVEKCVKPQRRKKEQHVISRNTTQF